MREVRLNEGTPKRPELRDYFAVPANHAALASMAPGVSHAGTFIAIRSAGPGPVRVDPEHPFHFVREGTGKHWFWNSTTPYMLLG